MKIIELKYFKKYEGIGIMIGIWVLNHLVWVLKYRGIGIMKIMHVLSFHFQPFSMSFKTPQVLSVIIIFLVFKHLAEAINPHNVLFNGWKMKRKMN